MNEIPITMPAGLRAQVVGCIVASPDVRELYQDMLEVQLPSGVLIDVGWVPEYSPDGSYLITASEGLNDLTPPVRTKSAVVAARHVEGLVKSFAAPDHPVASSTTSTTHQAFCEQAPRAMLVAAVA